MRFPRFILATLLVILWLIGIDWLWSNSIDHSFSQNGSVIAGGFSASQSRYLMLTARQSDLELQGQEINQERMKLAAMTSQLFNASSNLDPESENARDLQAKIERIQNLDKALELQSKRIDSQLEAVETELQAVRKVLKQDSDLYREIVEETPKSATKFNDLGVALLSEGKLEEAIANFRQAIELEPNFDIATNNLEEAERQLAIRENPPPPVVQDYAWVPKLKDEPWSGVQRSVVKIIAKVSTGSNIGTGWIVKREKNLGWIITNCHVVTENDRKCREGISKEIEIEFYSKPPKDQERRRQIAQIDYVTQPDDFLDLAVLKIMDIPDDIKSLPMSSVDNITLGTQINVVGHPLNGGDWTLESGEISNTNDPQELQLSKAILASGNSGGPVLDEEKKVIGVIVRVTSSLPGIASTGGFGFAYRISVVREKLRSWDIL